MRRCGRGGGCQFQPLTGEVCDDGALCTTEDVCVLDPSGVPACVGRPACDDGDPCTDDSCDPQTGTCVGGNPPIDCDDGDPCTQDTCLGGACQNDAVADVPCDDGSPCTTDERCTDVGTGVPLCLGTPVTCDDGSSCTLDVCDEATGACTNPPAAIPAVPDLEVTGTTGISWTPTGAIGSYNSYRGTIAGAAGPAGGFAYNHTCLEMGDALGDGPTTTTDTSIPGALGEAWYYVVSFVGACGESAPCLDHNGTPCPSNPCALTP